MEEKLFHFVFSPEIDTQNRGYAVIQKGMCGQEFTIDPQSYKQFAVWGSRSLINHELVNCPQCLAVAKFNRSKKGFEEFCEMYHSLHPEVDLNQKEYLRSFVMQITTAYRSFMNNSYGYCDLCGEPRTYDDIMEMAPDDYLSTCTAHRKYAKMIQVRILRKILGIEEHEVSNIKFTEFFFVEPKPEK